VTSTPARDRLSFAWVNYTDSAARALVTHRRTLAYLVPLVLLAAVALFLNIAGSPQRIDDEGTYTAQAYAVTAFGQLSHYTYFYDHPPLGWIQIAGYAQLTGAFARYAFAVFAAREAVVVASIISVVLLWFLARKLGLSRPASAAAGLIFALSPLAIQFHRTVYIDNIATPWLLAAFLLALSRRTQLASYAASAACFSVAVLSKETYLLALPFLIWMLLRSANPATRRYTLSVAGSVFVLIGSSYVLLAAVKGELFPGRDRVSLLGGVSFQLATRNGSGSPLDPNSLISKVFAQYWHLDPVLIILGALASMVGLFLVSVRPFAAMMVFLLLFMLRPGGYLPVPYVIMLIPFAALLIAAVTDRAVAALRAGSRLKPLPWLAVATAALVTAVPLWTIQNRGFFLSDLDSPLVSAEKWVETNVAHDNRLIVDDSMWVDLERAGWARNNVVWYYKVDTDPAVKAQSPQGWKDSDYVITTNSMRTFPDGFPQVRKAIDNSIVVASFGSGIQQVDIRRINAGGLAAAKQEAVAATAQSAAAGQQLAKNPALTLGSVDTQNLLTGGRVDIRIELALGTELATQAVTVDSFPLLAGESTAPRRQAMISSIGGRPTVLPSGALSDQAKALIAGLTGPYKPLSATAKYGVLVLTFSPAVPAALVS
jgi:4-amino-4-deoxy-L-arabinose transferase-like glycosyltransferase